MTVPAAQAPLFVLGPARGGTTYLGNILFEWFGYGMGPEGTFVQHFGRRLARYGDLREERNLARLVDDVSRCETLHIARCLYPPEERFDVTPGLILEHLSERSYAGVVRSVLTVSSLLQGKPRIGIKSPDFWRHLPFLESLFPGEARYLFIIRDGRDVALSLRRETWGENTAYSAARSWARCVDAIRDFSESIEERRWCLLHYEALLRSPEEQLPRIAEFLEMTTASLDREALVASARSNPLRENFGKWRVRMSQDERRIYEAVAGEQLARHGYERTYEAPFVRTQERAYYVLEELARRTVLTARRALGR